MKKIIKPLIFLVIPVISIYLAYTMFYTSLKTVYFSGYCSLLNNRTIVKYFSDCSQGVNDSVDNLYFNLEIKIIFFFYILCLINLYLYRKKLRKLGNPENIQNNNPD